MHCTLLCIGILQPQVFVIVTSGLEGLHEEKHPRANNPEEMPEIERKVTTRLSCLGSQAPACTISFE